MRCDFLGRLVTYVIKHCESMNSARWHQFQFSGSKVKVNHAHFCSNYRTTLNASKLTKSDVSTFQVTAPATNALFDVFRSSRGNLSNSRKYRPILAKWNLTRSSAKAKSTARPSCLVGVLYDIYRETNNRSTANQPIVRNWPLNLPNSAK